MQSVDVLRNNTVQFSLLFHLGQFIMCPVGHDAAGIHFLTIELIKNLGFMFKAGMAQKIFRLIGVEADIVLIVQAVLAPEIRDSALCGDTCAAKKRDVIRGGDHLIEGLIFFLPFQTYQVGLFFF